MNIINNVECFEDNGTTSLYFNGGYDIYKDISKHVLDGDTESNHLYLYKRYAKLLNITIYDDPNSIYFSLDNSIGYGTGDLITMNSALVNYLSNVIKNDCPKRNDKYNVDFVLNMFPGIKLELISLL